MRWRADVAARPPATEAKGAKGSSSPAPAALPWRCDRPRSDRLEALMLCLSPLMPTSWPAALAVHHYHCAGSPGGPKHLMHYRVVTEAAFAEAPQKGIHTLKAATPADGEAASLEALGLDGASSLVAATGRGAAAALRYPPPLPPWPCIQP